MLNTESALRKDQRTAKTASFEHRHFSTVAAILADLRQYMPDNTWDRVAKHFADQLAHTNPRFDRARFLRACGVAL